MSLKESVSAEIRRLSEEVVPGAKNTLEERLGRLKARLDDWNRSLASKALPESRRERVKNLVLEQKSAVARQRRRAMKVVRSSNAS